MAPRRRVRTDIIATAFKPRPNALPPAKLAEYTRLLLLGWKPNAIAQTLKISRTKAYKFEENLLRYGSLRAPRSAKQGRPCKLTKADEKALFEYLLSEGWRQQDELVYWLWNERDVKAHQSTVSRVLSRNGWSQKELKRISRNRSEELRAAYREDMDRSFIAEDLVFLDESIFNEKTGWRHRAYAPIGDEARYSADIRRGPTWSILAAMTIDGWAPCTGVKEGYWSREAFLNWLSTQLLPALREKYGYRTLCLVLDNVSIHTDLRVAEVVEKAGYLIRYLPPYSPDYNPIELTFSVLKAWIRRNWVFLRNSYATFGGFLEYAIRESRCDRFAKKHFKHSAGGLYIEEQELINLRRQLEQFELVDKGQDRTTIIEIP
jgi:transposase